MRRIRPQRWKADRASGGMAAAVALIVLLLGVATARSHDFGDDYGDTPTNAYPVNIGSNVAGKIEIDVDNDWFSFQAAALQKYTVSVATGTLWGSTLTVIAPDAITTMAVTDSIATATSRVSWVHFGPPATYYVGVGGFAQFTTGTYSVVVTQTNLDSKGMDPAWELTYFGTTNVSPTGDADGDGLNNRDEFLAGTRPFDPLSCLGIGDLTVSSTGVWVTCQVVPYRYYRLSYSTNLLTDPWHPLDYVITNWQVNGNMSFLDTNASPANPAFYEIQCVFQ